MAEEHLKRPQVKHQLEKLVEEQYNAQQRAIEHQYRLQRRRQRDQRQRERNLRHQERLQRVQSDTSDGGVNDLCCCMFCFSLFSACMYIGVDNK